jgi:hypothetical protein
VVEDVDNYNESELGEEDDKVEQKCVELLIISYCKGVEETELRRKRKDKQIQ